MQKLQISADSIKGKRTKNEDSYSVLRLGRHSHFLAIADGMGGAQKGDYASYIILKEIEDHLKLLFKKKVERNDLKYILAECFSLAQSRLRNEFLEDENLKGMGTTMTAVLIHKKCYAWGNLGDSRIYRMSEGAMHQITEDHTYIQEYLKNSKKKISEKILDQYSHILNKAIDGGKDEPDIFPEEEPYIDLKEGDLFLLCSDGLIINKADDLSTTFRTFIQNSEEIKSMATNLTSWAFQNGSSDNITALIASYGSLKRVQAFDEENKTIILKKNNNF